MAAKERSSIGDSREGQPATRPRSQSVIGRIVVVAVDSSENAKYAFDCEYEADIFGLVKCFIKQNIRRSYHHRHKK